MMPYTSVEKYQSLQIKSSTSRHQLLLSQMPNRPVAQESKQARQKRLKAAKAKRASSRASGQGVAGTGKNSNKGDLTKNGKKTVIEEMSDEYEGSDDETITGGAIDDKGTWQDWQEENTQLKDQLSN